MNYLKLREIILAYYNKSKNYEIDFFSIDRLRTKEEIFELFCLSLLDVNGYNADRLWSENAKEFRKINLLSINVLKNLSVDRISKHLKECGYNRGEKYTTTFAKRLKDISTNLDKPPINGDISHFFSKIKVHNIDSLNILIKEIQIFNGIGQKVGAMFIKFMFDTFKIWKWNGDILDFTKIPLPNDSQIRKVSIRLGLKRENTWINDLTKFVMNINLEFYKIDDVLWNVGRIFCNKSYPACHFCIFEEVCRYANLKFNKKYNELFLIDKNLSLTPKLY